MSGKGIFAQAREDLADIFSFVAAHGERTVIAGAAWYRLGDIEAMEGRAVRMIDTVDGSVSESKLSPGAGLSFEGGMDPARLRMLAGWLRRGP
ncbi:MAG: hypothetical protein ACAH83_17320 [Alphaproteobacteria bacterium]